MSVNLVEDYNNAPASLNAQIQLQVLRNRLFARYKDEPALIDYITNVSHDAGIFSKEPKSQTTPASLPEDIQQFATGLKALKSDLDDQHLTQLTERAQNTLR